MADETVASGGPPPAAGTAVSPPTAPGKAAASPEAIEDVKGIMGALAKMVRSFKLYSRNNEVIVKFINELYERLTAYNEKNTNLSFLVRPNEFVFADEVVYENADREESFAFKLYKEGIREITFSAGLDRRELVDFIDVVSTNYDAGTNFDDDVVTMLWKRDFDKITYIVVETFAEDITEEEQEEQVANIELLVNLVRSDKIPDQAIRAARLTIEDVLVIQQKQHKDEEMTDAPPFTPATATNIFSVTEAEFARVAKELEHLETQTSLDEMVEVVFEVFEQERELEEAEELSDIVLDILDTYLIGGEIKKVNAILKRLRFLERPDVAPDFKFRGVLTHIFAKMAEPNRMQQIFTHLNHNSIQGQFGDVFSFFSMQDPAVVPAALDLVGELQAGQMRRLVVDSMILLARGRVEPFAQRLKSDKWFVVTDMLYALGKMGGEGALPYLLDAFDNEHPRVRQEVVSSLRKFHSPQVRERMLRALDDVDAQVRTLALRHLANARDAAATPMLQTRMQAKAFQDAAIEEKKRYFTALAMIAGPTLIPFFREQLTARGLLNKLHLDEMRAGAATALGIVGNPEALAILDSGRQSTNKSIRECCEDVLRKLGRAPGSPNAG